MRKILLGLAFIGSVISATAQTIYSEDFANGIPDTYTLQDRDGLTSNYASTSFPVGTAWATYAGGTDSVAASTSWYVPAGTANDWMITPSITLQAGAYLSWKGSAYETSYADGYKVYVIDGSDTTEVFSIAAETNSESGSFVAHGADLSSYGTKTIQVAFVNNSTDMNLLYIDDIMVNVPDAVDVEMTSIAMDDNMALTGNTITGVVTSLGSTDVTSVNISYDIDGGTAVDLGLTAALSIGESGGFTLSDVEFPAAGTYTVNVFVSAVNGSADPITSNDKLSKSVTVFSASTDRVTLVEIMTSITCPPCAATMPTVNALVHASPNDQDVVMVTYQGAYNAAGNPDVDFPMYTPVADEVTARYTYLEGSGYPTGWVDGVGAHAYYVQQAALDAAKDKPAFFTIDIDVSKINLSTDKFAATATITPLSAMSVSNLRAQVAVIEAEVEFHDEDGNIVAPGTNGENEFHSVLRGFLNTVEGESMPSTITTSDVTTITDSFTINTSTMDFKELRVVAWVENTSTKQVWQAGATSDAFAYENGASINELSAIAGSMIYPTVATDQVTLSLELKKASDIKVEIMNTLGQVVAIVYSGDASYGANTYTANVASLTAGNYFMNITVDGSVSTEKFIVGK